MHQSDRINWRSPKHYARQLTPQVRSWLLDEGSLTARLIAASSNQFAVKLLQQDWRRPRADERLLLGLASRHTAQVRNVVLLGANQPWVFARSVIPATSLIGPTRQLRKLQNRSLGSWLFDQPSMYRERFQICYIPPNQGLVPAALQQQHYLWGRRSCFMVAGRPLLVCEVFLPAFMSHNY